MVRSHFCLNEDLLYLVIIFLNIKIVRSTVPGLKELNELKLGLSSTIHHVISLSLGGV